MNYETAPAVIGQLVAPVVMISACGLLSLALYNRLAVVVSRMRSFHHEQLTTHRQLGNGSDRGTSNKDQAILRERLQTLELQVKRLMDRARLLRASVMCLLGTVAMMLLCSLAIGMSLVHNQTITAALALFVVGVLTMLVGVVLAMIELSRSLEPVDLEQDSLERLQNLLRQA
ncbi:MAG: DUF2721 domain-containing protein [Phycisphaera sp.]|nr:DUF2721 domain-containing protein [Phycisphaera sp.]